MYYVNENQVSVVVFQEIVGEECLMEDVEKDVLKVQQEFYVPWQEGGDDE